MDLRPSLRATTYWWAIPCLFSQRVGQNDQKKYPKMPQFLRNLLRSGCILHHISLNSFHYHVILSENVRLLATTMQPMIFGPWLYEKNDSVSPPQVPGWCPCAAARWRGLRPRSSCTSHKKIGLPPKNHGEKEFLWISGDQKWNKKIPKISLKRNYGQITNQLID